MDIRSWFWWTTRARQRARVSACLLASLISMVDAAQAQGLPEQGFRIITTGTLGNCVACHALPGQRDLPSTLGPTFEKVGLRLTASALRQWISDARQIKPDTLMPPFGTTQGTHAAVRAQPMLSGEQIEHVVAALQTLR